MTRGLWMMGAIVSMLWSVQTASAGLFDDMMSSKKKKEEAAVEAVTRKFKFTVHLTTGEVLKGVEYKGVAKKKGSFRFISNFESDIEIKTQYIKYIDMDLIGEDPLDEEYKSSKSDRVYLRNQDFLTGKVVGFAAKDVLVATSYGDIKASVLQVRYIMFRNPSAGAAEPLKSFVPSKAPASAPAKSEPAAAEPEEK